MVARIEVEGLTELKKALGKLEDKELRKGLRQTETRIAKLVAQVAKEEAPVGPTGRTKKSIGPKVSRSGVGIKSGTKLLRRVPPIHWGDPNRNIDPNEYMYRAIDKTLDTAVRMLEQGVTEIARKAGLK